MRKAFSVLNVRCGGCANTVKKALSERFENPEVDLSKEPREILVEITSNEDETWLRETMRSLGYPFSDEKIGFMQGTGLKAKSFVSCAIGKIDQPNEEK